MRTVYGFGYAFAGEVEAERSGGVPSAGVAPRVLWEKRVIPLVEGDNVLGRDEDVTVRIDAPGVSRRHARIRVSGAEATIEDLGSKNGTYVGDAASPITGPTALPDDCPVPPRPRPARLPQLARGGLDDDRAPGIGGRGMSERWTDDDREAALLGLDVGHAAPRAVLGRAGCRAGPRGPVDAAREAPARVHHRPRQLLRNRPTGRPAVRPGRGAAQSLVGRPVVPRHPARDDDGGRPRVAPPRRPRSRRERPRLRSPARAPSRAGSGRGDRGVRPVALLLHGLHPEAPRAPGAQRARDGRAGCGRRASTPSCSSPSDPSAAGPWDWSSGRWRRRGSRR